MKNKGIFDVQNDTASVTHVGLVRKENEDNLGFAETPNGSVFVVCDGMGGHVGGKQASALAVDAIIRFMGAGKYNDIKEAMTQAIKYANKVVYETAEKNPALHGMGTTVVMVVVQDDKIYIAHVGDSRIYLLSDEQLYRLTKDHSFVQELFDRGIINNEEMQYHSRKNEITKALGLGPGVEPEVSPEPLRLKNGDKILLCSDGLSDMVDDFTIREVLLKYPNDVKAASKELLQIALNNGGKDNITFQIIHITNSNYKESIFEDKSNVPLPPYTSDHKPFELPDSGLKQAKGGILPKKALWAGVGILVLLMASILYLVMWPAHKPEKQTEISKQYIVFEHQTPQKLSVKKAKALIENQKKDRLILIPVDKTEKKWIKAEDSLKNPTLKDNDTVSITVFEQTKVLDQLPGKKEYLLKKKNFFILKKDTKKPLPNLSETPETKNAVQKKTAKEKNIITADSLKKFVRRYPDKLNWKTGILYFKKDFFIKRKYKFSSLDNLIRLGIIKNLPEKLIEYLGGEIKVIQNIKNYNKDYLKKIEKELKESGKKPVKAENIKSLSKDFALYKTNREKNNKK